MGAIIYKRVTATMVPPRPRRRLVALSDEEYSTLSAILDSSLGDHFDLYGFCEETICHILEYSETISRTMVLRDIVTTIVDLETCGCDPVALLYYQTCMSVIRKIWTTSYRKTDEEFDTRVGEMIAEL
ncbi:hypothetical protein B0T21DRAFT_447557 [Apiosordaria backusii]|uniref:Uncharacterized protein n=1 Tax=Apiosordaria backusii TaxID=314023 RepID=A0AA40K3B5_9PEZI|nr:hypothetical protein B0T21DRAFT_447557 [Apiosordaria backusii]